MKPSGWLDERVRELPLRATGDAFAATRVSEDSEVRIARGSRSLALLFPVAGGGDLQPDLRLANLSVTNRARCRVVEGGHEEIGEFGIVECTAVDPRTQEMFVQVIQWLLPRSGSMSVEALRRLVDSLVRLFSTPEGVTRTTALGLWGELWLISRSPVPEAVARAWHSTPQSRWDFAAPGIRMEVKTTTGARRHHFSLEQLAPPPGSRLLVASIVTAELPGGPSIADLLSTVVETCRDHDTRSRTIEIAMASLGPGWPVGQMASYDADLAETTLRILDGNDVPRVPDPPVEVSAVSFTADVEDVDEVPSVLLADFGFIDPIGG